MSALIRQLLHLSTITLCAGYCLSVDAQEIVIDSDGRQIQLNDDGSWSMLSRDRFATNEAGERIRIRADGTWAISDSTNSTPAQTSKPTSATSGQAHKPALDALVSVYLAGVEIQRKQLKQQKRQRTETRTIYTVRLVNNSDSSVALTNNLKNNLVASSSRGTQYDIESVRLPSPTIAPGNQGDITVIAIGSPQWFGVKYLSLEFAETTFGSSARRILRKDMGDVVRTDVEEFH